MEKKKAVGEDISSAQAVLLGALAPGVNGPTWNTLKAAFVLLGLCLALMLGLAFTARDSSLILHVAFLVLITVSLFLLLSWKLNGVALLFVLSYRETRQIVGTKATFVYPVKNKDNLDLLFRSPNFNMSPTPATIFGEYFR
ncbi:hypothetical protein CJ030_MR2G006992 [Morella rubra]|uniref:Uncharacterized protein n=1 Tax=Morella rubra TaxID=262757 RepID=A0A6A1WCC5_9ROSI|nr:hypothetical protein CJ030_MR2G006992 [Morella rubra]